MNQRTGLRLFCGVSRHVPTTCAIPSIWFSEAQCNPIQKAVFHAGYRQIRVIEALQWQNCLPHDPIELAGYGSRSALRSFTQTGMSDVRWTCDVISLVSEKWPSSNHYLFGKFAPDLSTLTDSLKLEDQGRFRCKPTERIANGLKEFRTSLSTNEATIFLFILESKPKPQKANGEVDWDVFVRSQTANLQAFAQKSGFDAVGVGLGAASA